jgi:hypothetical protein
VVVTRELGRRAKPVAGETDGAGRGGAGGRGAGGRTLFVGRRQNVRGRVEERQYARTRWEWRCGSLRGMLGRVGQRLGWFDYNWGRDSGGWKESPGRAQVAVTEAGDCLGGNNIVIIIKYFRLCYYNILFLRYWWFLTPYLITNLNKTTTSLLWLKLSDRTILRRNNVFILFVFWKLTHLSIK